MKLAKVAAAAVRQVFPGAYVITGGSPNKQGGDFLRAMVKHGAKSVFDAVAIHQYKVDAKQMLAELRDVRELLAELKLKAWKLRVTEWGWATGGPFHVKHTVDEAKHARLVRNTLTKLGDARKELKLKSLDHYQWRDMPVPTDFGGGGDYWGLHTGLLRLDGSAKPALSAFGEAARQLD
jgi:hypothetical protein